VEPGTRQAYCHLVKEYDMSEEKALVPVEQKDIDFYGDEITAVLVELDERKQVFIPIRSICDYLGLSWAGQRQRIH
jgi:hypothetical protein